MASVTVLANGTAAAGPLQVIIFIFSSTGMPVYTAPNRPSAILSDGNAVTFTPLSMPALASIEGAVEDAAIIFLFSNASRMKFKTIGS